MSWGCPSRLSTASLIEREPSVSQALVRYTAQEMTNLVGELGGIQSGGFQPGLLPKYRLKIVDGNHLGATDHRLQVLRDTAAGANPGKSLVVLDPALGLVIDLYRKRWRIETLFQVATTTFHCEIKSFGYPRAALFSFSMALVAYNLFSTLKSILANVHGSEFGDKLSYYYLADE